MSDDTRKAIFGVAGDIADLSKSGTEAKDVVDWAVDNWTSADSLSQLGDSSGEKLVDLLHGKLDDKVEEFIEHLPEDLAGEEIWWGKYEGMTVSQLLLERGLDYFEWAASNMDDEPGDLVQRVVDAAESYGNVDPDDLTEEIEEAADEARDDVQENLNEQVDVDAEDDIPF